MPKMNKRDYFYILIPIISFIAIILFITNGMYLYGSELDWLGQHVTIPDYFRTLFYETKSLFPDFALNIGNGQNIYNLSYYGLLSPIILISYLLPKVDMVTYIIYSSIITIIISTILLYIFLKKHNYSSETCLISSMLFISSTALSFHTHRHIMFINYMPFLILGLFGVDKKLDDNKGWLLTISIFLMIMSSYYFSICGIATLMIYSIYHYLNNMKKPTIKSFITNMKHVLLPTIVAIVMSFILLLPTFATLIGNRLPSFNTITLSDLFSLNNPSNYLYKTYGLGLTAIIIPAMIHNFKNNKHNLFLSIVLTLIMSVPIFNYILNGTMYIDAKILIPMLPLYIIVIANFIKDIIDNKINYKLLIPITVLVSYFILKAEYKIEIFILDMIILLTTLLIYNISNKKVLLVTPIILFAFMTSLISNKSDTLALKYTEQQNKEIISSNINKITKNDKEFYRISNKYDITNTVNDIYGNINYYNSTIYSSISNKEYNILYYDILNNNIPSRNKALTVSTDNIFYLLLTNNKYIISQNKPFFGYELVSDGEEGIKIYRNNNVLPLGFASSNLMSYEDFNKLNNAQRNEAILHNIIVDKQSNNQYVTSVKPIDVDLKKVLKNENVIFNEDNTITIDVKDTLEIDYKLPKKYHNKILFISFKNNKNNSCGKGDQIIIINGVKNKLTCKSWKYHNQNYTFDYVLATPDIKNIHISLNRGKYELSDITLHYMDPANIENIKTNINEFDIDENNIKGDKISGIIDVTKDGYFTLSIPYDEGFKIKVDNKLVEYEKVNGGFIGFPITEGSHDIDIEYKAPYKTISLLISLFGTIVFSIITYLEYKRKF